MLEIILPDGKKMPRAKRKAWINSFQNSTLSIMGAEDPLAHFLLYSNSIPLARRSLMTWQTIVSTLFLASIFFLSFVLEAGKMGLASHVNALMIVLGGTLCATLMSYPMRRVLWTLQILKKSLGSREKSDGIIQEIVRLARDYRRGWDVRQLEEQLKDLPAGPLRTGVEMIAYRYDREKMEAVLDREARCIRDSYESASGILNTVSQILPSMGLIGTIANFVRFLGLTQDIQGLAACAAAAFLSTFYGILLARVGLVPLSNKLKEFITEESFRMDLIREGILDIRDQEHPRAIQFKLESYLSAREMMNSNPRVPEVVLPGPEEVALGRGRVGPVLNN
jgi:chemotaxis protein MotA